MNASLLFQWSESKTIYTMGKASVVLSVSLRTYETNRYFSDEFHVFVGLKSRHAYKSRHKDLKWCLSTSPVFGKKYPGTLVGWCWQSTWKTASFLTQYKFSLKSFYYSFKLMKLNDGISWWKKTSHFGGKRFEPLSHVVSRWKSNNFFNFTRFISCDLLWLCLEVRGGVVHAIILYNPGN